MCGIAHKRTAPFIFGHKEKLALAKADTISRRNVTFRTKMIGSFYACESQGGWLAKFGIPECGAFDYICKGRPKIALFYFGDCSGVFDFFTQR